MRRNTVRYAFIQSLLLAAGCSPKSGIREPAVIEGERLVLTLDRNWSREQKNRIAMRYDLDTLVMQSVFERIHESLPDSVGWTIEETGDRYIKLSKPLIDSNFLPLGANDIILFEEGWLDPEAVLQDNAEKFGTNLLENEAAIVVTDSIARFTLPGYDNAESVYLSGSFNNWSTLDIPMKKAIADDPVNDRRSLTSWTAVLKLLPGKYTYRYIVDGRWITDPRNLKEERQKGRGTVSVFFMPNITFELQGRNNARNAVLTGSFINWNRKGIPMMRSGDKWKLDAYLATGTWTYKFIVDNEWITDPSNKDVRSDAWGNMNSFLSIGESHLFRLNSYKSADKVVLAGSFNNWSTNELVMQKDSVGWHLDYALGHGNWEYKFIVDGEWMPDPENPYTSGSGDYTNSVLAFKPTHTFRLDGYQDAGSVIVTGTFCDWSPSGYRMVKDNGGWIFPVHLGKGKWLYKFIVDGDWILDPVNPDVEENQYGTGNSVLWIGQ